MAKLQDPMPHTGFRLMCRDALPGSPLHIGFQVVQGGLQGLMIAIGTGLRHAFHHTAPLSLGAYQRVCAHFDTGEPIFPHLIALSPCMAKGDVQIAAERGRPVTPVQKHAPLVCTVLYSLYSW